MLALCYAAEYPEKAGPIVLVGCGTFDQAARHRMQATIEARTDADLRNTLRRLSTEFTNPTDRFMQALKLTRHLFDFDPIDPSYPDQEEPGPFDLVAHEETWNDMLKLQADGVIPGAFEVIKSPVLMLHGQYDPHPGRMIRDSLLPYLPKLEYHEFEDCGHSPWIEKSAREVFFPVLCEWLKRRTG
jgi:pimeloyl-ACP methyl ester carboxylesterase